MESSTVDTGATPGTPAPAGRRRLIWAVVLIALVAMIGWAWTHHLVPAVHPDHDHGLENIAGGGFLRVERLEGGTRNLVGRPDKVFILHWFKLGSPSAAAELPLVVDYALAVGQDQGIEVVLIAVGDDRKTVADWARSHGLPTGNLYVDRKGDTASLIGAKRIPETLIYAPDGHLVHQARGPIDWSDPQFRAAVEGFKAGGEAHQH